MSPVRVLIVDDSATVRAVVRRIFAADAGIEVVGEAADGAGAVEETFRLRPDVVLMDLDLPVMNGYEAIAEIVAKQPTPIIVLTSQAGREKVRETFRAAQQGVVGLFPKPTVPDEWGPLASVLCETVHHLGSRAPATPRTADDAGRVHAGLSSARRLRLVAIGASTGGPGALCELLRRFGPPTSVAVAVVQHISPGFEEGLAEWLAQELDGDVEVARDGETLDGGSVRIAPADFHLCIDPDGRIRLDNTGPARRGHRPSADDLFRSLIPRAKETAGVLLSGMGQDGVDGLEQLRAAGALTLVQDQGSCAVYGMPRAAVERGVVDAAAAPAELGRLLRRLARGEKR